MSSIDYIISELRSIPNALGEDITEPWRSPRDRGMESPECEQVGGDPTFDVNELEFVDRELWEEKKQGARQAIEGALFSGRTGAPRIGIDALAWYVSFHQNQQDWGIYIPQSSLALMDELSLANLPIEQNRRFYLAWRALLLHEQMHFAVDYACTRFELMLKAPIRREFMARFDSQPPLPVLTVSETYLAVEEAAANAHMLRELGRAEAPRNIQRIEQFVKTQPLGYREGLNMIGDVDFAEGVADTLRNYLALWAIEHRLDLGSPAMNLSRLLPLGDDRVLGECPIYSIHDLEQVGVAPDSIRFIQCITDIMETEKFERQLLRQDEAVRRDWSRKKQEIKTHLPRHPRFEKLKNLQPPTWSLRLRSGHRVHLQPPDPGAAVWRAVAIGSHKEMGHG